MKNIRFPTVVETTVESLSCDLNTWKYTLSRPPTLMRVYLEREKPDFYSEAYKSVSYLCVKKLNLMGHGLSLKIYGSLDALRKLFEML